MLHHSHAGLGGESEEKIERSCTKLLRSSKNRLYIYKVGVQASHQTIFFCIETRLKSNVEVSIIFSNWIQDLSNKEFEVMLFFCCQRWSQMIRNLLRIPISVTKIKCFVIQLQIVSSSSQWRCLFFHTDFSLQPLYLPSGSNSVILQLCLSIYVSGT